MLKQRNYNEMVAYILEKIKEMDISEDDKKTLFAYITSLESKYFMEMGNAERKGKWILAEDGWYCSVCELYPQFDCDPEEKGIPFCPHCGARMDGEDE